jgi:hypothetical protein
MPIIFLSRINFQLKNKFIYIKKIKKKIWWWPTTPILDKGVVVGQYGGSRTTPKNQNRGGYSQVPATLVWYGVGSATPDRPV